ncbi:MAG: hypothetical protein HRT90_02360 [Candidatus Margulisbacteria bacterium]|nr:hypothetical protein [Candidatus Margulisiibacteriota bacterium]
MIVFFVILLALLLIAYWRRNNAIMIIVALVLLGTIFVQQCSFHPHYRYLLEQGSAKEESAEYLKGYAHGVSDFREYVAEVRLYIFAESFLLFLACLRRKE